MRSTRCLEEGGAFIHSEGEEEEEEEEEGGGGGRRRRRACILSGPCISSASVAHVLDSVLSDQIKLDKIRASAAAKASRAKENPEKKRNPVHAIRWNAV